MAAPHRRLILHIVVVQRGEVGKLDRDRGRHDPAIPGVAELRGQQHQGGAEPLAARIHEVAGGLSQQRVLRPCSLAQALLNQGEAINDLGRQRRVGEFHRDNCDQSGSLISPASRPREVTREPPPAWQIPSRAQDMSTAR